MKKVTKDNSEIKIKYKELQRQQEILQNKLHNSVAKDEHEKAVLKCNSLFEELKHSYNQHSGNLTHKVNSIKEERKNLAEKLTDSSVQVHKLHHQVNGYKVSLRKNETRLEKNRETIRSLNKSKKFLQAQLKSLAKATKDLLKERSEVLKKIANKSKQIESLSKELQLKTSAFGTLTAKNKVRFM